MEFLVRAENRLPPDTPDVVRARLKKGERARADELRAAGILKRLWRVPGRNATVGLYDVADATELHEAISSLPMFPWLDVTVEAVATHPQEQA
jgi:muconolactone D-isomerase